MSAAGNRLKPISGTSASDPSTNPVATTIVRTGFASARCSVGTYQRRIAPVTSLKARPPSSASPSALSTRLARNGITVYATNSEASTVNSTAAGSERMNRPAPSGRNSSGRNANSSVTVQPSTASAIWSVAAIAASTRE